MAAILVIQHQPPFNSAKARENLDLVLALAAVDHQVSLLFSADAVFQLLPVAADTRIPLKPFNRSFSLFAMYDIEQLYVCQQSMQQRGLSLEQLLPGVLALTTAEINALISRQQQVINA
ncbi:sulfurtransferase complex subunit TusC [Arsukibacterium sp.]|uniref:sulfurtransferase complex subunit TusC n=1 Tax=Arsukibacterium sp. TaxID=1977258 RepID=UPI002FD8D209